MTLLNERSAPDRIRELRRPVMMFGLLFVLWWIVEFFNFAGRVGIDTLDVTGVAILAAGGWLALRAWQARCPRCGNRFFINSGLPLGFHFCLSAARAL
jgi:hypothetical protein